MKLLEVAVYVYAESEEQAHELVSNMYYDQEIILTEDNHRKQQNLSFKTTKRGEKRYFRGVELFPRKKAQKRNLLPLTKDF